MIGIMREIINMTQDSYLDWILQIFTGRLWFARILLIYNSKQVITRFPYWISSKDKV